MPFVVYSSLKKIFQSICRVSNLRTATKWINDIHLEDLVLEIRAAVHAFPGHVSSSLREMLDYI